MVILKHKFWGVVFMLKQEVDQELDTPVKFVKRDGAKYPFELFKLEMVIHALS